MSTIGKSELVDALRQEGASLHGLSKAVAARAVDELFGEIISAVRLGKEVRLVGFGKFAGLRREASEGRNPRTGEKITIAAQVVPKFSAAKHFKDRVNEPSVPRR